MKEEHAEGMAYAFVFILIIFFCGFTGALIKKHDIRGDCINFGKFQVGNIWYICEEGE